MYNIESREEEEERRKKIRKKKNSALYKNVQNIFTMAIGVLFRFGKREEEEILSALYEAKPDCCSLCCVC